MKKTKSKIIFTIAGILMIAILTLGLIITNYGTKKFTETAKNDASKEIIIKSQKLELTMKNIENSVNQLANISLKMLDDVGKFSIDKQ